MVNIVGSNDDFSRWKPPTMQKHLTITELARKVNRDVSWLRKMESKGTLPVKPVRVKVGRLDVRLYSPADVKVLVALFKERDKAAAKRKGRRR